MLLSWRRISWTALLSRFLPIFLWVSELRCSGMLRECIWVVAHCGIRVLPLRVVQTSVFDIGFAETTSSFNGVFYSIFQFTGCFGTAIGGVIKQLTDDNRILFTVLTVVGAVAVISLFILPSVQAYTLPGQSEEADVWVRAVNDV